MSLLAILLLLYFLPTLVAAVRRHDEARHIFIGNLFLGWTGLGWLWFLALAINPRAARRFMRLDEPPPAHLLPREAVELEEGLELVGRSSYSLQPTARQAADQLRSVHTLASKITAILDRKLNPHELTYSRYKSGAELLRQAVAGNIAMILSLLRALESIDNSRTSGRLQELRRASAPTESEKEERQALEERESLAASQRDKIGTLLSRNETAITELNKLAGALAEANIAPGRPAVSLDTAVQQLEELAEQLKLYEETPFEWDGPPATSRERERPKR